jgi:anti-sigma B factor antagonist
MSLERPIRQVRREGDSLVAEVAGEIDLNRSLDFQQQAMELLDDRPRRLVINLSGVKYMDSSGVASLVKLLSRARKHGVELLLVELQPRVRSVFEITRLDGVFTICNSESEAISRE